MPITGIHHITLCARGAQEDVDFITTVMGQRLIKTDRALRRPLRALPSLLRERERRNRFGVDHFPYRRVPGRPGSGRSRHRVFGAEGLAAVLGGPLQIATDVEHSGVQERFGQQYIRFTHPSGLLFEIIEDPNDTRAGWTTDEISSDVALRGFHGPVLSVQHTCRTGTVLRRRARIPQDRHRWPVSPVRGRHRRRGEDARPASRARARARRLGFRRRHRPSPRARHRQRREPRRTEEPVRRARLHRLFGDQDRNYFHSIYVRSPGGILTECAASVPEGFGKDEPIDQLGTELLLPPWFEERRAEIVAMLEPITVPAANRPAGAPRGPQQRRAVRHRPRRSRRRRRGGRARTSSAATFQSEPEEFGFGIWNSEWLATMKLCGHGDGGGDHAPRRCIRTAGVLLLASGALASVPAGSRRSSAAPASTWPANGRRGFTRISPSAFRVRRSAITSACRSTTRRACAAIAGMLRC